MIKIMLRTIAPWIGAAMLFISVVGTILSNINLVTNRFVAILLTLVIVVVFYGALYLKDWLSNLLMQGGTERHHMTQSKKL